MEWGRADRELLSSAPTTEQTALVKYYFSSLESASGTSFQSLLLPMVGSIQGESGSRDRQHLNGR